MVDKDIRHYTDKHYKDILGKTVILNVYEDQRILHSKLHTSGHLISNVIEHLYPFCVVIKGHHFPGECYVEFCIKEEKEVINVEKINEAINDLVLKNSRIESLFVTSDKLPEICPNLPYSIPDHQSIRVINIEGFGYQPCGGTHTHSLGELKGLRLTKFKIKGNSLKVNYQIAN